MKDKEKTKEQLMNELVKLRQQITELQKSEIKHQQTEETLRENEEKYRVLIEMATDCIHIETVEGSILECNTTGAKMFGYTKEEMIGLSITDLVPEEFAKKIPKTITEKEVTQGIFVPRISKKKDGTIFPTEIATKIVNIGGKPRLIVYVRDITRRKKAEKKLRKARKMFTSLFNSSPEATLYHDKEGRIININPRFTELFGYTLEEMIGKKIDEGMIYPTNKIKEGKILTQKAYNGFSDYETVRKKKDGTLVPVTISSAPVIIDKKPYGTIALYKDITERKKAEETLQESQQEFASLFKSNSEALVYTDEKGTILNINSHFIELFGYSLEEIKGRNINCGIIHPPDKMIEGKELDNKALSHGYIRFETIRKKRDGTLFPVSISGSPVMVDGQPRGMINTFIDITERKKAEETLQKSQQEFASLFINNPEALVYVDEEGSIININPRFTELFGYTLEEIKGRNIDSGIVHPSSKLDEGEKLTKKLLKGYFNFETIRKKKDGTLFPVSLSISNIVIDGKVKGGIGIYIDITERKKLEEKLRKLAHYDVLTGCYSRGYGLALLEEQIKIANRKKTPILLLYFDVDEFKEINDTYGHKEGDRVLKEVAQLFKSTIRKMDIICRIGGDEFILIFLESSLNNAPLIRERLSKNLEKLNQSSNKPYEISFSMGLSVYDPFNPLSIEELIKIADENMYEEKKKKKEGK
jgi:diguanylate cyclase (GGDEF)-like protein/PAS domain S-box-containing protein